MTQLKEVSQSLNADPDLNPLVASSNPTLAGEENSVGHSDPLSVDHTSEHRLGPSISCHDKAVEPRIELRGAIQ